MSAPNILNLSRTTKGDNTNTTLEPWTIPFSSPFDNNTSLVKALSSCVIGDKKGTYFIRCPGTRRSNKDTDNQSSLLIIDGDSRVTVDGEIVSGAPDPVFVHHYLTRLGWAHCIYSSYSNGKEGADFHKYRAVIPTRSPYSREQLPVLIDALFSLFHDAGIRLYNARENRAWSQPWFFPRVPNKNRLKLFRCYVLDTELFLDPEQLSQAYIPEVTPIHEPEAVTQESFKGDAGLYVNPIKLFNAHWGDPFLYLQTQGYRLDAKTNRMIRPGSTSGEPGVIRCTQCHDGVLRVFSFGGDILNDKAAHDAFDCYRLLEHRGDEKAALKAVGQGFIINGITLEKHNQIQHKAAKQQKSDVVIDWASLGVIV